MSKERIVFQEHSLDASADGELLTIVNEESFENTEGRTQLVAHSYMESDKDEEPLVLEAFSFKEFSTPLSYKLVTMAPGSDAMNTITPDPPTSATYKFVSLTSGDDTVNTITSDTSPTGGQYYVIRNSEMFSASSAQKKTSRKDGRESNGLTARSMITKKRDANRRATHNEVERRRRDKINNWIMKLARLVPGSGAADAPSKGGILAKACEYITDLTVQHKRFQKLEKENGKLVTQVLKLSQEVLELQKQNVTLRNLFSKCNSKESTS